MLLGLVGKPSCGKSTFFKAATLADVLIADYPFATIKPNHGMGYVKIDCIDKELNTQCQPRTGFCIKNKRFVPVELMDVAGLVSGASKGKGLGNQFLDDLRQADVFIHIIDISGTTDAEGKSLSKPTHNPLEDIKMLETEIDLWYLGILEKVWKSFARTVQNTKENLSKAITKQFSGLKVTEDDIKEILLKLKFNTEKPTEWSNEQLHKFAHEIRTKTKPMIIAANKIDKPSSKENFEKLKKEFPEYIIVGCSADSELALKEASKTGLIEYNPGESDFKINKEKINEKQKQALKSIRKNVLEVYGSTGIQEVLNQAVFDLLKYIAIFPAGANKLADSKGNVLPDCFLVPEKTTALDFAYHLHTDLGDNFIKAIDARTKKPVGKEHPLKHRDGIEIITK
jgi:ribosome-binding ATPase YchF (GTP1/OBG family)